MAYKAQGIPQQRIIPPINVGNAKLSHLMPEHKDGKSMAGGCLGPSKPQFLPLENGDNNRSCFRGWLEGGSDTTSVHSRCSANVHGPSCPPLDTRVKL